MFMHVGGVIFITVQFSLLKPQETAKRLPIWREEILSSSFFLLTPGVKTPTVCSSWIPTHLLSYYTARVQAGDSGLQRAGFLGPQHGD